MIAEQTYQDNFILGVYTLQANRPELDSTQKVAELLGIKYMTLYKVMDRTNRPTTDLCIRLCRVAGYNANWMFLNIGPMYLREHYSIDALQKEVHAVRGLLQKALQPQTTVNTKVNTAAKSGAKTKKAKR